MNFGVITKFTKYRFITWAFIASFWAPAFTAHAQSVSAVHFIDEGFGNDQPTREYLARTPYKLSWNARKNLDRYWKEDPLLKEKAAGEVMFDVFDIDKQEYVFRTGWQPLVGEVAVPVAGRHRLKVHALGKWSVSFIEDKAALEAAAKRGEIQPGKTIDQAKLSSGSTRRDKLQAAKISALAELEKFKGQMSLDAFQTAKFDLEKAAQLASSEQDFLVRYEALSKISRETTQATSQTPVPRNIAQPPHQRQSDPGLPPGMKRRNIQAPTNPQNPVKP